MKTPAFALIIAIEEYGESARLTRLDGTLSRAETFVDWLLDVRDVDPANVFLCTEPRSPRHDVSANQGAARRNIREAAQDLADKAKDKTADLFVLCSGHGGRVKREDVLVASDFVAGDGENCIRLAELHGWLSGLGPGTHYWFVDACRTTINFKVPKLKLPQRFSRKGQAISNDLFATVEGATARAVSSFPTALAAALRGDGRAKEWINESYWVTFPRLAEVVRDAVKPEGMTVDPKPARVLGQILQLAHVVDTPFTVQVRGAIGSEQYHLLLSGGDRPLIHKRFSWPAAELTVPPGLYWAELELDGTPLDSVVPKPGTKADLYDSTTLVFAKCGEGAESSEHPPQIVTLLPPVSPKLSVRAGQGRHTRQLEYDAAAAEFDLRLGPVEVELWSLGEPVTRVVLGMQARRDPIHVEELLPTPPLFERIMSAADAGEEPTGVRFFDLMSSASAQNPVVDRQTSLLLALLGAASICDTPPYQRAVEGFASFDELEHGAAGIYILTDVPEALVIVDDDTATATAGSVGNPGDTVHHMAKIVEAGEHRVRLIVSEVDTMLATATLHNRVTLITFAFDDRIDVEPIVQQFALPASITGDAKESANIGILSAVEFSSIVQRRFARRSQVMEPEADAHQRTLWSHILRADWPDPFTVLTAGYELVRRGELAVGADRLGRLLTSFRERFAWIPADVEILESLMRQDEPTTDRAPLFLDGVLARGRQLRDPDDMELDYSSPWTQWQAWPRAAGYGPSGGQGRTAGEVQAPLIEYELPSTRTQLQERTTTSRLNLYLNFNGNARQALEFYAAVFGGNLTLSTFADFGATGSPDTDKIMHGMLETEAGYTIMAADVTSEMEYHPMAGFSVSLSGDNAQALHSYWEKLSASGTTTMPLQKQVWGDEFGMCVDQFGVSWLVDISQPQA